jgi:glycosyltransferase involved in cell wall biosynthesis
MAERTKIYISSRVIAPPASGGALQITASLANRLFTLKNVDCTIGVSKKNKTQFAQLLDAGAKCTQLDRASDLELAKQEEAFLKDFSAEWCFYPFPSVNDSFTADSKIYRCVCIYDIQHLECASLFPPADRWKRDKAFSKAICCADLIATISDFSARQIRKHFSIPQDRVSVIYAGPSQACEIDNRSQKAADFIFYPANAWPHKNHGRLVEAFQILRKRFPTLRLIFTGDQGQGAEIRRLIRDTPSLEHLGYVSAEKLQELMRNAKCLVFPSLYEGFGMPVIEALMVGTPVACSNTTSLPEVGGDAAEYFDPNDVAQMAQAVERAISNASNPEWQERAKRQAAKFTFDRSAKLLLEAMEEVSSRGPDPEVLQRRSAPLQLSDYWQSFPSLDAILLPVGCIESSEIKVEDFKALNRLDMARLNPISIGALFARGQKIAANGEFKNLPFRVYRQILCLVAEGKLVVHLPQSARSGEAQKISRLIAMQAVFWQLKILHRTCREAVMAVVTGKWGNGKIQTLGN